MKIANTTEQDLIAELSKSDFSENIQNLFLKKFHTYIHNVDIKYKRLSNKYNILKEKSSRYLDLYDYAPISYFTFDQQGKILEVNLTGAALLGYERDTLIGRNFSEFLSNTSIQIFNRHLINVFSYDIKRNCELKLIANNKVKLTISIVSISFKDKDNKILCRSELIDITESKRLKENLVKYGEILKKINLKKDIFFSIISHDLKSPFQSLLGLTEILMKEGHNMEANEISRINKELHYALKSHYNLLNNLLQWSKLQLGTFQYEPEIINVHKKIDEVFDALSINASQKEIKIENKVSEKLYFLGDRYAVQSIFQNIISNAIKFTHIGGEVTINASEGNKFIKTVISDTGVGIEKEFIKNLFKIDKHYQTPGTKKESGTGLGLILCKELVEKLNGKIGVVSSPGKGTSFIILIPKPEKRVIKDFEEYALPFRN